MKREEWLDRLDELVAEHVLGWTWWTWTDDEGQYARLHETMDDPDPMKGMRDEIRKNFPELDPPAETTRYTEGVVQGAEIQRPMWCGGEYTRSISDAWKLVEALKGPSTDNPAWSWGVEIAWIEDGPDRTGWCVVIQGHESPICESAPLAISIASLRAVGCEMPEEPDDG